MKPVNLHAVTLKDGFWASRARAVQDVTVPHLFRYLEELGRLANFDRAAGVREGAFQGYYPFDDSDVYKAIEAASYSLVLRPDPELERYLDDVIARIAAAQEEDGYLMTWRQIDPARPPTDWSGGEERWSNVRDGHELYNAGHLYEAAAAHHRATGKRNLLELALKNAGLVCNVFGPGRNEEPPGHEVIEMGLVQLYRETGEERFLQQAEFFLSARGRRQYATGTDDIQQNGQYWQDHKPVLQQDEAVGHAVRAGYLYSAMVDVAALLERPEYFAAAERIWRDVVSRRQAITGSVGAERNGESFGKPFELPNADSYNESCAALANVFWNFRMFLLGRDAKYLDVVEKALYNGALSGLSLKGDGFFYCNPLSAGIEDSWNQEWVRGPWQKCACCPPNLARFVLSVPGFVWATDGRSVYLNLFVSSEATLKVGGRRLSLGVESAYPWDGLVQIEVQPDEGMEFPLLIRIPGWVDGQAMPSQLYAFQETATEPWGLKVNGEQLVVEPDKGFVEIRRYWRPGDRVELELPMPIRRVVSDPRVSSNRGRVALQRGPVVFCFESADNPEGVGKIVLRDELPLVAKFEEGLLGGVVAIREDAEKGSGRPLFAVPYFAWANRGKGEMAVWVPRAQAE